MITFRQKLWFMRMIWKAIKQAELDGKTHYVGMSRRNVVGICGFVGVGREAWRISQRAIEEFQPEDECQR